jgi:hypothetical protein
MRTPLTVIRQWACPYFHTHERDWDNSHPDKCRHCQAHMPLDPTRSYVGLTNPSSGD